MADNAASGNANSQYGKPIFGFGAQPDSTGAEGSHGGSTYGAYSNGELPGVSGDGHAYSDTGADGSTPGHPQHDGGNVQVTDFYANLGSSQAPKASGTANTNAEHIGDDPFTHNGVTSTGAGEGSPGHSASGADQSSPWQREPYSGK